MENIVDERFSRQLALFGKEGQYKLQKTVLTLVGYGGLGTHLLPQIMMLGVKKVFVIEPEYFDTTNRSRYMGFNYNDIGEAKTNVAVRVVRAIDPECKIYAIQKPLESPEAFDAVKQANIVVGCLDSDGPRQVLNELCIAYEKPYIDMASEVFPDGTYGGRVAVVKDGIGCLNCMGVGLDQDEISNYFSNRETLENKAAVYGVDIKHLTVGSGPSVVSLNGVVASLGVTELQALITGIREPFKYLNYRGHLQQITKGEVPANNDCYFCEQYGRKEATDVERYIKVRKLVG